MDLENINFHQVCILLLYRYIVMYFSKRFLNYIRLKNYNYEIDFIQCKFVPQSGRGNSIKIIAGEFWSSVFGYHLAIVINHYLLS